MNVSEARHVRALLHYMIEPELKLDPERVAEAVEYLAERIRKTLLTGVDPAQARAKFESYAARMRADTNWNEAVDWLLNSSYTGEPEIQAAFWGMVDGWVTREQADRGYIDGRSIVDIGNEREGT